MTSEYLCGSSSVGRASAFQAGCREFESRLPLIKKESFIDSFLIYIGNFSILNVLLYIMGNIGNIILASVRKRIPISLNGTQYIPANYKFSLKDPYILEALPEGSIDKFVKFENQNLNKVCQTLNNPTTSKGFSEGELKALYLKAFPNIKPPSDANIDAMVYLNSLSGKIGQKFDAHGMAKGTISEQLKELNKLLTTGIDKTKNFFTAPLALPAEAIQGAGAGLGTAGGCAYRSGSFILVGEKSKLIEESGIKHVIVNDAYYKIINDLQRRFPEINFVRADKATEYFTKL